ncbi:MAG: hypothetical protein AAF329_16085 [Cyanobacteria bacterium P01_A01_bin.17]
MGAKLDTVSAFGISGILTKSADQVQLLVPPKQEKALAKKRTADCEQNITELKSALQLPQKLRIEIAQYFRARSKKRKA